MSRIRAPKDISLIRRFFLEPRLPRQRQYEALRAYFIDGRPAREAARAFGYTLGAFHVMAHHFRREVDPIFFVSPRHGPQARPKKSAALELIVQLRKQNHSVYEISQVLKERNRTLSPTAVREVLGKRALPRCLGAGTTNARRLRGPRSSRSPTCGAFAGSRKFFTVAAGCSYSCQTWPPCGSTRWPKRLACPVPK